jgi:hypothetical protein
MLFQIVTFIDLALCIICYRGRSLETDVRLLGDNVSRRSRLWRTAIGTAMPALAASSTKFAARSCGERPRAPRRSVNTHVRASGYLAASNPLRSSPIASGTEAERMLQVSPQLARRCKVQIGASLDARALAGRCARCQARLAPLTV